MNNEIQITWAIQDIQSRDTALSDKDAREVLFLIYL